MTTTTGENAGFVSPIAHGWATGGSAAFLDAVGLWANCAVGGARGEEVDAAVAAFLLMAKRLVRNWNSDNGEFRDRCIIAVEQAAGEILSACYEDEGSNSANASVKRHEDLEQSEALVLSWDGVFSKGRFVYVSVIRYEGGDIGAHIMWDTATGCESNYLHLPSMTDEADKPEAERREGGWQNRDALDDEPGVEKGRWVPGAGPNGLPLWLSGTPQA